MSDRYTASIDEKGKWLVFDNENFYCCYGPTSKYDAIRKTDELNKENIEQKINKTNKIKVLSDAIEYADELANDQDHWIKLVKAYRDKVERGEL